MEASKIVIEAAKEIAEAKGIPLQVAIALMIEGITAELDKLPKGEVTGTWRDIDFNAALNPDARLRDAAAEWKVNYEQKP